MWSFPATFGEYRSFVIMSIRGVAERLMPIRAVESYSLPSPMSHAGSSLVCVGLHLSPPTRNLVLSVDKTSRCPTPVRTESMLPMGWSELEGALMMCAMAPRAC